MLYWGVWTLSWLTRSSSGQALVPPLLESQGLFKMFVEVNSRADPEGGWDLIGASELCGCQEDETWGIPDRSEGEAVS